MSFMLHYLNWAIVNLNKYDLDPSKLATILRNLDVTLSSKGAGMNWWHDASNVQVKHMQCPSLLLLVYENWR